MAETDLRDDFDRIRLGQARLFRPMADPEGGGLPSFLGRVTSDASSLGVGRFFLAQPASVLGDESEGGSGTPTSNATASVPVYLLGPGVPSTGDYLVCRFVDHRWVAELTRGGNTNSNLIPLANCACAVPPTLTMTSGNPDCNYGMFQSCVLSYQTPPACFAPLNINGKIFLSTSTFIDRIEGDSFYYWLYCQNNLFTLTRLYCKSAYGSPYRDAALYNWLVGGYGNNCTPFYLHNGSAFPGSDATCSVTIDPA